MHRADTNLLNHPSPRVALWPLLVLLAGAGAAVTVALGGRLSLKYLAAGLLGASILGLGVWTGKTKHVLAAGWVFSLTYNRQYFVLDPIFGSHGAQGPYLIVADAFLFLLLLLWLYETVVEKRVNRPQGWRVWPWLVPFAAICLVSSGLAIHPEWGFFEFLRIVRIGLILAYFRYQASASLWISVLAGLLAGVTVQSSLGALEVVTGRSGILGILGGGSLETAGPAELRQESFYGWRRATATMSHPPNLACYLLMGIPPAFALACTSVRPALRWIGWGVTAVGLVGLACTLSRWPCAVIVLQLLIVGAGLVAMRLIPPSRFAGMLVLSGFVMSVAGLAFADKILDRVTRDFDRSVEFRLKENATGMRILRENPLLGVGPNNYREYLLRYNPEWEWALQFEEFSIRQLHIRPITSPHNGFLLIASETGLLGLMAFLLFCLGAVLMGVRALARTDGAVRAVSFGLLVGLLGLALQQFVDFSIWADPLLYTLALTVGLLNVTADVYGGLRGVVA